MDKIHVIVVGGGPGGYVAAIKAAQAGGKVTLVEKDSLGGTCINRGCIPTKVFLHSANLLRNMRDANNFGIQANKISVDAAKIFQKKDEVVEHTVRGLNSLMNKNKIHVVKGTGNLVDRNSVLVTESNEILHGDYLIIASGSRAKKLVVGDREDNEILTSDDFIRMGNLPKSAVIIGAGSVGLEFTQFLSTFGCKVSLVESLERILPSADPDLSDLLEGIIVGESAEVYKQAVVKSVEKVSDGMKIAFEVPSGKVEINSEKIFGCTGRIGVVENFGLESLGIETRDGHVVTDYRMETNIPGVYAIGDVVGRKMYAHVAMAEASCAVKNIFGKRATMNYEAVPNCIYTSPEVAWVGLTEPEAKSKYRNIKIGKFPYHANGRALTCSATSGMIKVISEGETGDILGVHIVGSMATELIAEAVLAIHLECSVDDIIEVMHAHPTLSEGIVEAALNVNRISIHV